MSEKREPATKSRRRGRPPQFSRKTQSVIISAIRSGLTKKLAAAAGGIACSTLMRWLADEREPYVNFRRRVVRAEAELAAELVECVKRAAMGTPDAEVYDGDWRAAAAILERVQRSSYGREREVEVEVSVNESVAQAAAVGEYIREHPERLDEIYDDLAKTLRGDTSDCKMSTNGINGTPH